MSNNNFCLVASSYGGLTGELQRSLPGLGVIPEMLLAILSRRELDTLREFSQVQHLDCIGGTSFRNFGLLHQANVHQTTLFGEFVYFESTGCSQREFATDLLNREFTKIKQRLQKK